MRIALPTCEHLPDWEVDDLPLHAALEARGLEVARPVWSDGAVDWSRFDACLIRTTWDYQERREEFLAWAERVAAHVPLFNPLPVIRWNTHKSYLRDLAERGVPIAPTVWLRAGSAVRLAPLLERRGWERAFLKPAIGATARETLRFRAAGAELEAAQAHADRLLPREDLLLQPYLGRVETEGELSAIFLDGVFSHAVRKLPVPGDYRVQDDFGARDERAHPAPQELDLAARVVRAAEHGADLLYARVDLLRDDDGALVVTELELVEPSLFFRHEPGAADRLATALSHRIALR